MTPRLLQPRPLPPSLSPANAQCGDPFHRLPLREQDLHSCSTKKAKKLKVQLREWKPPFSRTGERQVHDGCCRIRINRPSIIGVPLTHFATAQASLPSKPPNFHRTGTYELKSTRKLRNFWNKNPNNEKRFLFSSHMCRCAFNNNRLEPYHAMRGKRRKEGG